MAERRILPLLAIEANELGCAECTYLVVRERGAHCTLFMDSLEAGSNGPHRADECLEAEARARTFPHG